MFDLDVLELRADPHQSRQAVDGRPSFVGEREFLQHAGICVQRLGADLAQPRQLPHGRIGTVEPELRTSLKVVAQIPPPRVLHDGPVRVG